MKLLLLNDEEVEFIRTLCQRSANPICIIIMNKLSNAITTSFTADGEKITLMEISLKTGEITGYKDCFV